jgi:two-component system response regulator YesN
MYDVLLVFDNYDLMDEIKRMHIWGGSSEFEITDTANDGITAYNKMRKKHYDLVITEIRISGIDGLQLLRNAKRERLCSHIVLCSEFADFNYARQGIILGAFDYFVKPFDDGFFISMFNRIKNETFESEASGLYYTDEITAFFEKRSEDIYKYVSVMFDEIYNDEADLIKADKMARQICHSVFEEIFSNNEWLDLYVVQQDFYSFDGVNESNQESYKKLYNNILCKLFSEYCELYPYVNNEKIKEVILYILNNPENNLKQKSIATELYINSSYLSTVFLSQTGIRFVDYLNTVKLKRAAWLLKETDMKIVDIATKLDYKDMGYFSRLFKSKYNITPSGYRLPDEYDYQI